MPPSNATTGRRRSDKYIQIIVVSLLVGIALLWFIALNASKGNDASRERANFEQYLNEKYGQEFVVKDIKTVSSGLGVTGYRQGLAYAEDDKKFMFNVSHSTEAAPGESQYTDSYLLNLLSRDETSNARDFMNSMDINNLDNAVQVSVPSSIQKDIDGSLPTLESMSKQYPGEITYWLAVNSQGDFIDEQTQKLHYNHAYEIIEFLREKSDLNTSLTYRVYSSDSREFDASRYECTLENEGLADISSSSELNECFKKQGVK